jgi:hypothetical protein
MPKRNLATLKPKGAHPASQSAQTYLSRAQESANEILHAVDSLRDERVKRNKLTRASRPNEQEQDLLRAMLVSACAGVDAAIKTLIRDALPQMADAIPEVQERLDDFATRALSDAGAVSPKVLARTLSHEVSPRTAIVELMTQDLTGGSLQSPDQLLNVCRSFGFEDKPLRDSVLNLRDVFHARNQIIHEMDMSTEDNRWKRRLRSMEPMIGMADRALAVAQEIINRVTASLGPAQVDTRIHDV